MNGLQEMQDEPKNRYALILEHIFFNNYTEKATSIQFRRVEIVDAARELSIEVPKNIGDVIYSFRYRQAWPKSISDRAPAGKEWIIRPRGRSVYAFEAILPLDHSIDYRTIIEVPDSTPELIRMYAISDEQSMLSIVRYCRLIDIFTGITCFPLQSHLRTSIPKVGQIETDDIYLGIKSNGKQYILPVQAKGSSDQLSPIQIEQDIAMCEHKFPNLICKPIGVQTAKQELLALFEYEQTSDGLRIVERATFRLATKINT